MNSTATPRQTSQRERWCSAAWILVAALALQGGCATTGDPNEDTIFWSRRKADQRLANTQASLAEQQRQVADLARRNQDLRQADSSLEEQRDHLVSSVDALVLDCGKLERAMHAGAGPDPGELSRLRDTVAQLKVQTEAITNRRIDAQAATGKAIEDLESQIAAAHAHINALLKASGG